MNPKSSRPLCSKSVQQSPCRPRLRKCGSLNDGTTMALRGGIQDEWRRLSRSAWPWPPRRRFGAVMSMQVAAILGTHITDKDCNFFACERLDPNAFRTIDRFCRFRTHLDTRKGSSDGARKSLGRVWPEQSAFRLSNSLCTSRLTGSRYAWRGAAASSRRKLFGYPVCGQLPTRRWKPHCIGENVRRVIRAAAPASPGCASVPPRRTSRARICRLASCGSPAGPAPARRSLRCRRSCG